MTEIGSTGITSNNHAVAAEVPPGSSLRRTWDFRIAFDNQTFPEGREGLPPPD